MAIQRIGVLTSGGDAPGMNAAIRAVVRTGVDRGWEVVGVERGYLGLMTGAITELGPRTVGGIVQKGGTILGSARAPAFRTADGRTRAIESLERNKIDALVVVGGNGSQAGALKLHEAGFPVVGVASTIDNDLYGSDQTIGVDTALNVALEAIDRLKTTASAVQRAFLVEVMGRDCGYLALAAGLAGGAELIVIPERRMTLEEIADGIRSAYDRGKPHAIVVVAEGARLNAEVMKRAFRREELGYGLRVTILGHVQRGGAPGAFDRILATRLGAHATRLLAEGTFGVLAGLRDGHAAATPLSEVCSTPKPLDPELLALAPILAR